MAFRSSRYARLLRAGLASYPHPRQGRSGHRHNNSGTGAENIGLIYMNARWFLPSIGRFASADTLVPNPANPQSLNRYSYVRNNPLKYKDPTGHYECHANGICADVITSTGNPTRPASPTNQPLISFTGNWTDGARATVRQVAVQIGQAMADAYNGLWSLMEADFVPMTAGGAFRAVYGKMEFAYSSTQEYYGGQAIGARANNASKITFYAAGVNASALSFMYNIAHELGHSFNGNALSSDPIPSDPNRRTGQPYRDLGNGGISVKGRQIAGGTPYLRTALGYQLGPGRSQYPYRQNTAPTPGEDFADMFANWTFNSFTNDISGAARYNWINSHMPGWMALAVAANQ